jgi:hypothetical protein
MAQWRGYLAQVFEAKEWASLIGRSILPKLAYTLDAEFAVNPVAQELQAWHWVRAPRLPCDGRQAGCNFVAGPVLQQRAQETPFLEAHENQTVGQANQATASPCAASTRHVVAAH